MEKTVTVERYTLFQLLKDSRAEVVYSAPFLQKEKIKISPVDKRDENDITSISGHRVMQDCFLLNIMESCPNYEVTTRFGVAWKIKKSDGTYRYVRCYKGTYNLNGDYTPMRRDFDGVFYNWIDETELPITMCREDFEDKWFSDLTYYPELYWR